MLSPAQRQLRRHQRSKRGERVIERVGNQRVRPHNRRPSRLIRMHWLKILFGIKSLLPLHRLAQLLIRLRHRYGSNPGHSRDWPWSTDSYNLASEEYTFDDRIHIAHLYYGRSCTILDSVPFMNDEM